MSRSPSVFVWTLWTVVILFAASAYATVGLAVLPPLALGVASLVAFAILLAVSRHALR